MKLSAIETDIEKWRGDIVGLFEGIGQPEFGNIFDWYYSPPTGRKPVVWMLTRDDGTTVGTCSVVFREMEAGGKAVHAGVAGNLVVDERFRDPFAAISLIRATKKLVDDGQCDLLLGLPLESAYGLTARLGFVEISSMKTHTHVLQATEFLRDKFGLPGALAGPFVNGYFSLKRALNSKAKALTPVEVDPCELRLMDDWPWTSTAHGIGMKGTPKFLHWRFFEYPREQRRIFSLRLDGVSKGYVVLAPQGKNGASVLACETDTEVLTQQEAILRIMSGITKDYESVSVKTIKGSALAHSLRASGFVARSGPTSVAGRLMGYWRSDHELRSVFADVSNWNLYPGFNDV